VTTVAHITYTVFGGDVKPCTINQSIISDKQTDF